jgi:ATP-dependent Clp protease protease subunit
MTEQYSSIHNIIPPIMEYAGRDEPVDNMSSLLLQKRMVFLRQHLSDQSANLVVAQLLFLDSADPSKEIQLIISTPSGDIYAGLALYNTLQQLKAPVRTVASGLVGSYGAVLLAAGTPGRRYAQANATIHLHQLLDGAQGRATDLTRHAEQLLRLHDQFVEILARHTRQTPERIHHDIARDLFLTSVEAVAYGLVDDVSKQHGAKGPT